jgi:hypothetical protein
MPSTSICRKAAIAQNCFPRTPFKKPFMKRIQTRRIVVKNPEKHAKLAPFGGFFVF